MQSGAGRSAVPDAGMRACGGYDVHDVPRHRGREHDLRHGRAHGLGLFDGADLMQRTQRLRAVRRGQHRAFRLRRGVSEVRAGHEPVKLRLGQRIGAFQLDGILRGHHEEGIGQRPGAAVGTDLAFAHGLQHGRLGLGVRTVDLVGDDNVGEQRPGVEVEVAGALVVDADTSQVAGQHVGRELDATGVAADGGAECAGQCGLADAGHILQQQVPSGDEGGNGQLHHTARAGQHRVQRIDERVRQSRGFLQRRGFGMFHSHPLNNPIYIPLYCMTLDSAQCQTGMDGCTPRIWQWAPRRNPERPLQRLFGPTQPMMASRSREETIR